MGIVTACLMSIVFITASECGKEVEKAISDISKKTLLEHFKEDLVLYYIEPNWVLPALLAMPLDQFDQAWKELMAILRYRSWFCFVSDQKNYSEKKYREQFLACCNHYDKFLRDLVVDVRGQRVFLTGGKVSFYTQQPGIITIFQYWQAKKNVEYQHFYAFYFDRTAAHYVEAISNLFFQLDSPDYVQLRQKTYDTYSVLVGIFVRLKGGEYDSRYAQHLRRYDEVLDLLEKERKRCREGSL